MPFLVPALISTTPPQTTQEVRSSGNVVLCCHLVGAAALPGVPLVLSSLPSRFFFGGGGGYLFPIPLILYMALVEDNTWLNQKCGMSWWVSGPRGLVLGGQARGRGKWPQGSCQPALSDLVSVPSKVSLARVLSTLTASRNLVFVPELILRNSGNYRRSHPAPVLLFCLLLFCLIPLFSV